MKEIAHMKKGKTKHHEEDFQALIMKKNQEWYQKSGYTKVCSHLQPSRTTHNHPQPPTILRNHPQPPTTIHNYP